jgi:DNA-binding transcriptional LysR family regulator
MDIKQLKTFLAVAHELNISRAAEKLNYAQSSITTQIKQLESEFGTLFFERIGKRIELTDAGKRFINYAQKIVDTLDEAYSVLSSETGLTGQLNIGIPESSFTYRFFNVLQHFREKFPFIQLVIKSAVCSELRREVSQGELDLAFTLEPPFESDILRITRLIDESMVFLASPQHPLARQESINFTDLKSQTILVPEKGASYRDVLENYLKKHHIEPVFLHELFSVETIKKWTEDGAGITFLPEFTVLEEIKEGKLVSLDLSDPDIHIATQMVLRKDKFMSEGLKTFIQMIKDEIDQQKGTNNIVKQD